MSDPGAEYEQEERPLWKNYLSGMAASASLRGSCPRAKVGVLIVRDHRILATGYNGAPSGQPECIKVGCDLFEGHCIRSAHGEQNAIGQAARYGIPVEGSTLYVWMNIKNWSTNVNYGGGGNPVCSSCSLLLASSGIVEVKAWIDYEGDIKYWRSRDF